MEIRSIINKALFIFTIVLAIFSILGFWINIDTINQLIVISTVPIFIFNSLFILNSINKSIRDNAEDKKQYFKQFENDNSIAEKERNLYIDKEIIYDNIREKCEIKNNRILSTICVINIVIELLCICFKENIYNLLKFCSFNTMTIFSLTILIIDMCYKEKISNKVLQIYYNKALKNNNKFKSNSIGLKMG